MSNNDHNLSSIEDGWLCEVAPAKLNLFLHVTGRRENGYHELESLFAFTNFGDVVKVKPANELSLSIGGEFASTLDNCQFQDNIVVKAAQKLRQLANDESLGAEIVLEKNIPTGAGLGGGSSDAAATLRALIKLWGVEIDKEALAQIALELGADVPACLTPRTSFVSGIGEVVKPVEFKEKLTCVLVNDGTHLSTPLVFGKFKAMSLPFSNKLAAEKQGFDLSMLDGLANDLYPAAKSLAPNLERILSELSHCEGVSLARMSGSGASFFALMSSPSDALKAVQDIKKEHQNCWIKVCEFL